MKVIKPAFNVDWVEQRMAPYEGGLTLQVSATLDSKGWELLTVVNDEEDESLWVEFYVEDYCVRLPYAVVKNAIDIAPTRVFSAAEFERRGRPSE